jgi:hypothetical protein
MMGETAKRKIFIVFANLPCFRYDFAKEKQKSIHTLRLSIIPIRLSEANNFVIASIFPAKYWSKDTELKLFEWRLYITSTSSQ